MDIKASYIIPCVCSGYSATATGLETLKFSVAADQLDQYITLVTLLNNNLSIEVFTENMEIELIGYARIKSINIKKDGDAIIQFIGDRFDNIQKVLYSDEVLNIKLTEV